MLYPRTDFAELLDAERYPSQPAAVAAWFGLFFPALEASVDVDDPQWRINLGEWLKKHLLFHNLLRLAKGQIVALAELQQQMQGPLPEAARAHISQVLDALLVLVCRPRRWRR